MNKLVLITGKGKKKYFLSLCKKINDCSLLDKKQLPRLNILHLLSTTRELDISSANYIAEYFLKLKARKYQYKRPVFWLFYKIVIHIRARIYYARFSQYFKSHEGDWVGVWGGHYPDDRAAETAAKKLGKRILYFENGLLPNTTTIDPQGVNFRNSVPRNASFYNSYETHSKEDLVRPLIARKPLTNKQQKAIPLPARYVFVPFQVDSDTQIVLYGGWIQSMRKLFSVIQSTSDNLSDGIVFVFKEHPSSAFNYDDLRNTSGGSTLFANGNSTEELIKNATAVITVNSTVGIESLMLGKKVITLGHAFYSIPGVVKQANSSQELVSILDNLDSWSVNSSLIQKFIAYLQDDYLVNGSWRLADQDHIESMSNKLATLMNDN
ncbi:capsular biosynthesis protein [bacterium AH-315-K03]|nr:capsular biosynthesis protein [bacterium AH-315-K03]